MVLPRGRGGYNMSAADVAAPPAAGDGPPAPLLVAPPATSRFPSSLLLRRQRRSTSTASEGGIPSIGGFTGLGPLSVVVPAKQRGGAGAGARTAGLGGIGAAIFGDPRGGYASGSRSARRAAPDIPSARLFSPSTQSKSFPPLSLLCRVRVPSTL